MATIGHQEFVHTDPGTLGGRYMRRFWHPVYIANDLPLGRAVPIRVMGEDLTLYRGQTGTPHVVGFRCLHRGVQLSLGWVEGDCIRCYYHGWKYEASGQCVEQPMELGPFGEKVRIASYPAQEYLGLIFVYLGAGEPPQLQRFPALENRNNFVDIQMLIHPCNWTQALENTIDPVHALFTHWHTRRDDIDTSLEHFEITAEETEWGLASYTRRVDKSGDEGRQTPLIWPNMHYFVGLDHMGMGRPAMLNYKVPVDDEHHLIFYLRQIPGGKEGEARYREPLEVSLAMEEREPYSELVQKALAGKISMMELDTRRRDIIGIQDGAAQSGQAAIWDRRRERLGRNDRAIILLRQIWDRELRALADNEQIKQWAPFEAKELVPV